MQYQVAILSNDAVFSRMLELEFSMLHLKVCVLQNPQIGFSAETVLLDLDSALPPPRSSYRRMIGFTKSFSIAAEDARKQCSMIFHRPFEMRLLRREVLAELDRAEASDAAQLTHAAQNEAPALHFKGECLYYGNRSIALSPQELRVIKCLFEQRGQVVSKQTLSQLIGASEANKVEVYICYLRRKLEQDCGIRLIRTVRGKGYRLT